MKRDYRLLIFDWDGTLMDSQQHIVASMQAAMGDLGVPVLDQREVSEIIGLGMREALQRLFPERFDDAFHERFVARYRTYYFADNAPQALFADVESTLRALRSQGYRLAVATGKGRRGLDRALQETGLGALFHGHRCAEETASKPDPRMVHELLQEFSLHPHQALMVGDSEYDLEMAVNAGVDSVAVSYGVHEVQRLLRYDPIACLDRIADLPAVLGNEAPSPAKQTG